MYYLRPSFGTAARVKRVAVALAIVASATVGGINLNAQTENVSQHTNDTDTPASFTDWVIRNTLVVAGPDFNSALYSTPTGNGFEGVAALLIEREDGLFICSGALLAGGGNNVLTAAHCLTNSAGENIAQRVTAVFFPAGGPAGLQEVIVGGTAHIHPAYTGKGVDAHDIAVVTLSATPSSSIANSAYSLYLGNPFTTVQAVGSGATGTGSSGETQVGGFQSNDRRTGFNKIDFSWSDAELASTFAGGADFADDVYSLVGDFDSGLAVNNTACLLMTAFEYANPSCGLGFGDREVGLGGGDSGGPLFVGNQIAGVAAYNISFGMQGGDVDDMVNGSFGELSGWTSTGYNANWIAQFTTVVPEPGSMALVGMGLIAVLAIRRRRNNIS